MTGRDTKALTTSFARSETLATEGYTFTRVSDHIAIAQGQPTTHRKRGTGEIYIDPHGPYTVDTDARTCSCPAFANRGGCCHLPAAKRWLDAWKAGRSVRVHLVSLSKSPIAFREVTGSRYHCQDGRVVIFRSWEAAGTYWAGNEDINLVTEPVELRSVDLEELAATGKYAGLMLHTSEGVQAIPLPEVDWKARGQRGGFVNRKDFD